MLAITNLCELYDLKVYHNKVCLWKLQCSVVYFSNWELATFITRPDTRPNSAQLFSHYPISTRSVNFLARSGSSMYVCRYVIMHMYLGMYTCVNTCIYANMHVCMYALCCIRVCMHTCYIHVCMYECTHAWMHLDIYAYMYVCMLVPQGLPQFNLKIN